MPGPSLRLSMKVAILYMAYLTGNNLQTREAM